LCSTLSSGPLTLKTATDQQLGNALNYTVSVTLIGSLVTTASIKQV